jgi:hypothetical protein
MCRKRNLENIKLNSELKSCSWVMKTLLILSNAIHPKSQERNKSRSKVEKSFNEKNVAEKSWSNSLSLSLLSSLFFISRALSANSRSDYISGRSGFEEIKQSL